jgi:8-oxo-dGTP pyrophosphatase MutT (NUDIX family)
MDTSDAPIPAARKAIPRPPLSRTGQPASWAHLPVQVRRGITLDRVTGALAADRAGQGQGGSRESWRSLSGETVDGHPAAVLVPLFEEDGEARVILTVRSDRLRSHRGEVAFPGGRLDLGEGVAEGALREAREEVGLDPGLVTVVAALTAMPTVSSNTVMTPVVATLEGRPALVANPDEVDRVFDVALSELVAEHAFHEEWWSVPGRRRLPGIPDGEFPVWFFEVAGETVWGATARTLVELLCLVLGVRVPTSLPSP